MSDFNQQRGHSTIDDLVSLFRPLQLPATKFTPRKPRQPLAGSQLCSHFGGHPYFEAGETWPITKAGQPLDFIVQIVASEEVKLPAGMAVVQFFYSWEASPWDTAEDGWLVKTYPVVSPERTQVIERPSSLDEPAFCDMVFTPIQSLPNWEELNELPAGADAAMLAEVLNPENPWNVYEEAVTQLLGESDYQSTIGGYPRWLQGANHPVDAAGQNLPLLFQLDSEHKAGIMWGDTGLVYVFYDLQQPGRFTFELQCL